MIKSLLKKSIKSSLLKNLGFLVSGTVLAQLLVIGFQVVLRRMYTPEDFGVFGVYMSILGILATVSAFRYEQAIVLPESLERSKILLLLSILLSLAFSALLFIPALIFSKQLSLWLNLPINYSWIVILLPLSILLFSVAQALNFYLVKERMFRFSATNKVVRRTGEGVFQSVAGYFAQSWGLFLGDLVGQLLIIIRMFKRIGGFLKTDVSWDKLKTELIRYKDFPLKNGFASLMNSLGLLLPFIIINKRFTAEDTGYFELARMVLILPLSLFTASLSQVLLERFSDKRNKGLSVKKESLGIFGLLSLAGIAFALLLFFWGSELFSLVFGQEWVQSGNYAAILVWAFALKLIVSPFNIAFTAFEKIGLFSLWQIVYAAIILLLWFIKFDSLEHFLLGYLVIELVGYGLAAMFDVWVIMDYEQKLKQGKY